MTRLVVLLARHAARIWTTGSLTAADRIARAKDQW